MQQSPQYNTIPYPPMVLNSTQELAMYMHQLIVAQWYFFCVHNICHFIAMTVIPFCSREYHLEVQTLHEEICAVAEELEGIRMEITQLRGSGVSVSHKYESMPTLFCFCLSILLDLPLTVSLTHKSPVTTQKSVCARFGPQQFNYRYWCNTRTRNIKQAPD